MGKQSELYENEIMRLTKLFLKEQLGEAAQSVTCQMNTDRYSLYATNILSPAEMVLLKSVTDKQKYLDYKNKQFNSVKDNLKSGIEKLTGQKVVALESSISSDGIRIITMEFKE